MEHVLADVLRDQRNLGNKGDGGWKRSTLNVATAVLSTSFNVNVTSNNVIDDITTIQASEEWTRFRDTFAMTMFAKYQVRINFAWG